MPDKARLRQRRAGTLDLRVARQLPALRIGLTAVSAASALATLCTIVQALLLAHIIASVFVRHETVHDVGQDLLGLAIAMTVKAIAGGTAEWFGQRTSTRVRSDLRAQLLAAVCRLGPQWLARNEPGRLVAVAGPGIETLDGYITRAVPATIAAGITPPLILVAIGISDWPSLVIILVTLPLVPTFLALIGRTSRGHMDRQWATLAKLSGQFLDLLEGLTTLKIYGRSTAQIEAVREGTDRYRRHTMATLRVAFLSGLVMDLLATLSVALVAVAVGIRLDQGHLSLGRALTVLLLTPEVFAPLRAVGAQHHATAEARAEVDSVMEILDRAGPPHTDVDDRAPSTPIPGGDGIVARLTQVGYTYPGRELPALRRESLDVYAGQLVALTGPSGAGKSTVLALLLGQLTPTVGTVTVGGASASTGTDRPMWAASVAWVPQRPRPTQETVADEVRLGDPGLSDADLAGVLAWCAAGSATTPLGEDGGALSAGQRRRVALARAVARARLVAARGATPLVLLDEPTEDLDPATEGIVVRVLADLGRWAAVLIATHDQRLVAGADREIHMAGGHITADTTRTPRSATRPCPPDLPVPRPTAIKTGAETRAQTVPTPSPAGALGRLRTALAGARGARRSLGLACVFGALGGVSGLALTATSVWLICRAAQHPNLQALALAVVGVRTFALARALLRYLERLAAHDGALRLLAEVRARVFAALVPLAPAGLGQFRRGDLLRRFSTDVDGAQEALIRAAVPLAGAVATAATTILLVGLIDPVTALLLTVGLLLSGVVIPGLTGRVGAAAPAVGAAAAGRRDALVTGLLDGLEELTAYGATEATRERIAATDHQALEAFAPAGRAGAVGLAATGITAAVTVTAVTAAGARAVTAHSTPGVLLGVLAAAALVAFEAVAALPAAYAALGRCVAGLHRVDTVLATPIPLPTPSRATVAPTRVVGLSARGITVRPSLTAPPVLVGADLEMEAGQRVAVMGPSGCGKSTLLASLLRLVPTDDVPITLHAAASADIAVGDLAPSQLPPLIAGSLQGDHVFATTLRDNLRLVAPAATDADLDVLAGRVGLAEWVTSLPQGWGTQAGADGHHLSGGQRQRLLLARALLAGPEILVLDEPTAHLDEATASAVMADLHSSTAGRTLIMSTHHAGLLENFDHVLLIDDNRIVGRNTHQGGVQSCAHGTRCH